MSPRLRLSHSLAPSTHQHYDFLISSVRPTLKIKSQKETGSHGIKSTWMSIWRYGLNPDFQHDHSQTATNNFCYQRRPTFPRPYQCAAFLLSEEEYKMSCPAALTESRCPDLWGPVCRWEHSKNPIRPSQDSKPMSPGAPECLHQG